MQEIVRGLRCGHQRPQPMAKHLDHEPAVVSSGLRCTETVCSVQPIDIEDASIADIAVQGTTERSSRQIARASCWSSESAWSLSGPIPLVEYLARRTKSVAELGVLRILALEMVQKFHLGGARRVARASLGAMPDDLSSMVQLSRRRARPMDRRVSWRRVEPTHFTSALREREISGKSAVRHGQLDAAGAIWPCSSTGEAVKRAIGASRWISGFRPIFTCPRAGVRPRL